MLYQLAATTAQAGEQAIPHIVVKSPGGIYFLVRGQPKKRIIPHLLSRVCDDKGTEL